MGNNELLLDHICAFKLKATVTTENILKYQYSFFLCNVYCGYQSFALQLTTTFLGSGGLLFGGVLGIARSRTPALFAVASGLQWFALGSTFAISRAGIAHAWEVYPTSPPEDRATLSAAAGGVTGGFVGAVIRGHRNVIPGTLMFTIFGYVGQSIYNRLDERHTRQIQLASTDLKEAGSLWRRIADSRWSPMSVLSDDEYADALDEKLFQIRAEIAVLDDDIEKLREQPARKQPEKNPENP